MATEQWHLDKKIPIALILTLIFQTSAAIWWASGMDRRMSVAEAELQARRSWMEQKDREEVNLARVIQNLDSTMNFVTQSLGETRVRQESLSRDISDLKQSAAQINGKLDALKDSK